MRIPPNFRFLILIILAGASHSASACLNDYTITEDGAQKRNRKEILRQYRGYISMESRQGITGKLDPNQVTTYDFKDQINISVSLIKTGDYEQALKVLEPLAIEYPDSYAVHSNLGTLYELMGQPQIALKHIQKGLDLHPGSHRNSEWMHVKILEAKLGLETDPDWLATHPVLDFSTLPDPSGLYNQGYYQLASRIPFSPQPSPILSQMCLELGNFLAEKQSIHTGHQFLLLAQYFADDPQAAFADRLTELEAIHAREMAKNKRPDMAFASLSTPENLIVTQGRVWHNERVFIGGDPSTVFATEPVEIETEEEPEFECAHAAGYAEDQEIKAKERRFNSRLLFAITALVGLCILGIGIYMALNKKKKR